MRLIVLFCVEYNMSYCRTRHPYILCTTILLSRGELLQLPRAGLPVRLGGPRCTRSLKPVSSGTSFTDTSDRVYVGDMCLQKYKLCRIQVPMADTTAHKVFKTCQQVAAAC